MKLIRLVMSAFGSYADEEIIEFDRDGSGIFLITGDTGAGKTTIFDAVTYALYDETSGRNRSGNMMRSQYAGPDRPTFVELVFEYSQNEYRIRRNPEYSRESKRKNADGTHKLTTEKAAVSLIMPDGSEFMGKKAEINDKIIEITGLNVNQFVQTAMIAQGDFMRLLYADSSDRREIFSRIFGTQRYRQIQQALYEHSKNICAELEESRKTYFSKLDDVKISGAYEVSDISEMSDASYENIINAFEELKQKNEPDCERAIELIKLIAGRQEKELSIARDMQKELQKKSEAVNAAEERRNAAKEALEASVKRVEELDLCIGRDLNELKTSLEEFDLLKREADEKTPFFKLRAAQIEESMPYYEQIKNLSEQIRAAESSKKSANRQLEMIENDIGCQKELLQRIRSYQQQNKDCHKKYQQTCEKASETAKRQERKKELAKQLERLCKLEQSAIECAELYKEKQTAYEKADQEYRQLEHIFMSEQAAILASQLKEQEPCPVCGSMIHPMPCAKPSQEVTEESMAAAKKARDNADACRQDAMKQSVAAGREYESHKAVIEADIHEIQKPLPQIFEEVLKEAEALDREKAALDKDKKNLKNVISVYDENENNQQECFDKIVQLEAEQNTARDMLERTKIELAKLAGQQNSIRQQLEFGSLNEAKAYLEKIKADLKSLKHRYEKMNDSVQKRQKELDVKQGEAANEKRQNEKLLKEYNRWETNLNSVLHDNGFDACETGIRNKLSKDIQKLSSRCNEIYSNKKTNEEIIRKIDELNAKRKREERRYAVYGTLYETACGKLNKSAKMDFETYVLRRYFGEIINAANHRLAKMNDGQWRLKRRNIDDLGSRGQSGLDLDVHDEITNSSRNVKTLSGGETFMAALSMALGMADIIQNQAGAVKLDTMFIDEGFGSLDDYSRQQAIGILCSLAGEKRTIGIISHVTELKEQIEKQLVVSKTGKGSHAVWKK